MSHLPADVEYSEQGQEPALFQTPAMEKQRRFRVPMHRKAIAKGKAALYEHSLTDFN